MKKYYLHDGVSQQGPFDIEELKEKKVQKDTPIWYEGLENWMKVADVPELQSILPSIPPPYSKSQTPPTFQKVSSKSVAEEKPKKKSRFGVVGWIILIVIIIAVLTMIANNPNSIPGVKVQINTPKPIVVTKRIEDASSILKLKETIYATILNQGGDGNVLVTFHLMQDGNDYTRTESVYMRNNQSFDLNQTFDEVTRLGGDMKYYVEVKTQ